MRSIGRIVGGVDSLIYSLLLAVGSEGTILVPTFARLAATESANSRDVEAMGILSDRIRARAGASRGSHPILSFAALGKNAAFLTENTPFHYPLGTNSPLARLYQLNGAILLLGVGHNANAAIHLAEVWADAPYARRQARIQTGQESWEEMEGSPECSAGFAKIERVLRQARILREGYVGNAPSQFMRIQHVVSMAAEMLRGDPEILLCDDPSCEPCTLARRFTAEQRPLNSRQF